MNDQHIPDNELPEGTGATANQVQEPNYEAFGLWLDLELEKLVARWAHLAAPNATRSKRHSRGVF
jgi:hypothetical protein